MDIRQLEVLAHVIETRSFSRAARALGLTQSTVSEHIRQLEEEVGTALLDRLPRETLPTGAGELLHGYARRIMETRREAMQALAQYLGEVVGRLVLGASTIPGEYLLPPLIGRFRSAFPRVAVALEIGDTRSITQGVLESRIELGVVGGKPEQPQIEAIELMPDELVVVVPPGHAWFGRSRVALSELLTEPLIVREPGSGSREALEAGLARQGCGLDRMHVIATMGSTSAAKQAVKAGVGVSILSNRAVAEEILHGLLGCVKIEDVTLTRSFYAITRLGRTRSPICHAFLEYLLKSSP